MKVLVDTSIWSLALRKKSLTEYEKKVVQELKELIYELRVVIIGPIRQELLSGISDNRKYELLKERMRSFDDLILHQDDYEFAAKYYNDCRKNGIQGSHIDYLICSSANNRNISIFTTDKDFKNYKEVIGLKLHKIRDDI